MQMTLSSIEMNYRNIQADLNRLYKWCFTNGLIYITINSHKTKVDLSHEKQYKYLRVILYSKLNFEAHYKEIVKTFSFKLFLYRRMRNCMAAKLVLKLWSFLIWTMAQCSYV